MANQEQSEHGRALTDRRVVEIRTLSLKQGTRSEFHRLYVERSLPLLRRWKFDVVSYGPSLHDDTSFYVARAYADLAERQAREDAFYGSDDWRCGPREALLALIESYVDVVLELDESAIEALRRNG
jgi:hypothetical protein